MTNAFGIALEGASLRWAAAEAVPETVIAAVLLLHETAIDEIVGKVTPHELEHVLRNACSSQGPKRRAVAGARRNQFNVSAPPPCRVECDADDMRRAQARQLARLRPQATVARAAPLEKPGTRAETARRRLVVEERRV